jgi:nucleoside-diphosphate-sugar epimerase
LSAVMALPRQFRRLRISLIGFGDVARRALDQHLARRLGRHGPRLILIGRSPHAALTVQQQQLIQHNRFCVLSLDIDASTNTRRIARISQAGIIFAPTAESGPAGQDPRARRIANGLRDAGKRIPLVYLSTTGVYGDYAGGVVTEISHCHPTQARSQRRLDAENILRPIGCHVLRVPGIYAHDRLPTARIKAQQPALTPADDVFTNHIHADDLANIAWRALFIGRPSRVTNAVDRTELKMADYFDAVADALQYPRPPRISAEQMRQLGRSGAVNPMMMSFLSESRRVHSSRLASELRIRLRYPTVHDTLKTIRAHDGAR